MQDPLPGSADPLRHASETDLIRAWTAAVGEKPACLVDREAMIGILFAVEGPAGLERALAALRAPACG